MNTITLSTAFLITQFALLTTTFIGFQILSLGEDGMHSLHYSSKSVSSRVTRYLMGFALSSLACLICTEEFVNLSQPIFSNIYLPSLTKEDSFLTVFLLDILGAALLMGISGGSKDSPFSSLLFGLPALSIFLKEPPSRFLIYTALAACLFWVLFSPNNKYGRAIQTNTKHALAYKFTTLASLGISTIVGYTSLKI